MEDIPDLECALRCAARSLPGCCGPGGSIDALEKDREKWKSLRPSSVGNLFMGKCSKKTCNGGQKTPS